MSLFAELKRRNVIRVGLAYAIVAWVLAQIGESDLNWPPAPVMEYPLKRW